MTRHVKAIRFVTTLLFLAASLPAGNALGQTKSLRERVVGAWALASFESFDPAGAKVPSMEGGNLKGRLTLTSDGLLSVQIISGFPKLGSKDRLKTTAAEEKAVAHGVLSFFCELAWGPDADRHLNHLISLNFEGSRLAAYSHPAVRLRST